MGGPKVRRVLVVAAMVLGILNLNSGTSLAVQFCNTTRIVGTGGTGPSTPYPSTIEVSGLVGTVTDVNVTLLDVRTRGDNNSPPEHWVEDIDVMVSAPNNANVILMSDAGGDNNFTSGPVVDADLTFDQQAPNQLPADTGPLVSGTYRPVDDDVDADEASPVDAWPAPAPPTSNSTNLNDFNNINPNGTWSLWVVDDTNQAAVDINGGWCIDIITTGGGGTSSTSTPTSSTSTSSTTPTSSTSSTTPTSSTSSTTPTSSTSSTIPTSTSTSTTIATTTTSSSTTSTTFPAGTCGGLTPTIVGTGGDDNLVGTAGPDVISGGAGADSITGLGGDDVICGGDGNDSILGGDGADRIFGEAGLDTIYGENGNDTLSGGVENDRLFGGNDNDALNGDAGLDQCIGEAGTDTATGCEQVIGVP